MNCLFAEIDKLHYIHIQILGGGNKENIHRHTNNCHKHQHKDVVQTEQHNINIDIIVLYQQSGTIQITADWVRYASLTTNAAVIVSLTW